MLGDGAGVQAAPGGLITTTGLRDGSTRPARALRAAVFCAVLSLVLAACGGSTAGRSGSARTTSRVGRSTTSSTTSSTRSTATPPTAAPSAVASAVQPCGDATTAPAHYHHVVWIWMENQTWSDIFGNSSAPYLNTLAGKCTTDSDYASVGSPSLPNYLGATSGSTQGVADDDDPSAHTFTVDNLFRQVRAAGGTERSFAESMPAPCTLVSAGSYAAKHNPAVYYVGGDDRTACQADDVPFTAFSSVLASGQLPTFTSITPNICDDMHSCSVATGDQWLATWVPQILDTASYRDGTTALFIVWDEPTPLANVMVAPSVRPGTVSGTAVNQYSLLRATEEMLGLPLLGQAATAPDLRTIFGI